MIIDLLQRAIVGDRARLSARVTYEDSDRPPREVFFEVDAPRLDVLFEGYEPFVLAMIGVAAHHGEARLRVDGPLCPELADNVRSIALLQHHWFGERAGVPAVEARSLRLLHPAGPRAAGFVSGGVDSTFVLARNLRLYPPGDPRRISVAILCDGLDIGDPNHRPRPDLLASSAAAIDEFVSARGCESAVVTTNARSVEPDWRFYADVHHGPLLAGIAHALGGSFSHVHLANDMFIPYTRPYGSHPWLNSYFWSSGVQVVCQGEWEPRIGRYASVLAEPGIERMLRVCWAAADVPTGFLNCGRCYKCVRGKVELVAHGADPAAFSFADATVSAEGVARLRSEPRLLHYLRAPVPLLRARGRDDVADALERAVANQSADARRHPVVRTARRLAGRVLRRMGVR